MRNLTNGSSGVEESQFTEVLNNKIQQLHEHIKKSNTFTDIIQQFPFNIFQDIQTVPIKWRFLTCCLIFIKLLQRALNTASQKDSKTSSNFKSSENQKNISCGPHDTLSVSQHKTVARCVQFICGLGIIPSLLRGVGIPLERRTGFSQLLIESTEVWPPWKKHRRLVACVIILIDCLSNSTLGSMILSQHAGDLLAALIQLCYAPIKKLSDTFGAADLENHESKPDGSSYDIKFSNILQVLEKVSGPAPQSDEHLILEMWEDRHLLKPKLYIVMNRMYQPLLVRELILLQGAPSRSSLEKKSMRRPLHKAPKWLQSTCGLILTNLLMKSQGLLTVITGVLESCSDPGFILTENINNYDWMMCEAIVNLVAHSPIQATSVEEYYQNIGHQVLHLLKASDKDKSMLMLYVASSTLSQMTLMRRDLSFNCILSHIFKPFLKVLHYPDKEQLKLNDSVIIPESEVEDCVEQLHKLYVCGPVVGEVLKKELMHVFLPLFQLMCSSQNGISHIRSKIEDLVLNVFKWNESSVTVRLLHTCVFESEALFMDKKIRFVNAPGGGMMVVYDEEEYVSNQKIDLDNWLTSDQNKVQCILRILEKLNDKTLEVQFFLSLLQKLTELVEHKPQKKANVEKKDNIFKVLLETEEQNIVDTQRFRNSLILLQLLQGLIETVGDHLMENRSQVIEFVKAILEHSAQFHPMERKEDQELETESVAMALGALAMLVDQPEQLKKEDWDTLKKCQHSLQKIAEHHPTEHVQKLTEELNITIGTHGAAGLPTYEKKNQYSQKIIVGRKNQKDLFHNDSENKRQQCVFTDNSKQNGDLKENTIINGDNGKEQYVSDAKYTAFNNDSCLHDEVLCDVRETKSPNNSLTPFKRAWQELHDPLLPVIGHALITLKNLILSKDSETLESKEKLLGQFQEHLRNGDTFIYLSAVQGLAALVIHDTDNILPLLTREFLSSINTCTHPVHTTVVLGEVLTNVCRNLGTVAPKYRDLLLPMFLVGVRNPDYQLRTSCLSNLGEICKLLKFSLGPYTQEIFLCLRSVIQTDKSIEARRAAVLVISLLLQGLRKELFEILESELRDLYRHLRHIYNTDQDEVMKLHAQVALEEINEITRKYFSPQQSLTKELRIIQ
ncbi:transport and Golgi organization protein 6 homolog isoform X2 [Limulus polyphemus]|uniref:Transport and Golgi organization protein 6 homolog isoform X2 n=1 Tax=Limulus polyphemus TaxID=6850 RepID=A0ABM1SMU6_LIMPO|nr:transport and Golgi organization protein 6 homolog isoform X2 [Limulus polyphemus]